MSVSLRSVIRCAGLFTYMRTLNPNHPNSAMGVSITAAVLTHFTSLLLLSVVA